MHRWFRRRSVYFIIAYLILMAGASSLLYSRYETLTQTYTQNHVREFDQRIESYKLMQEQLMDSYYELFFNSSQIAIIMDEAANSDPLKQAVFRRELMGRTEEAFASLKQLNIRILVFHLPGQIAFLRVQDPEKFGDSTAAARPSIVQAQAQRKKLIAFETGKVFDEFRSIYPIFHNKNFAGTVEIGYPFLSLKKQAIRQSPGAYTFLVKRSIQEKKSKSSDIVKYYHNSLFGAEYIEDQESALEKDLSGFTKDELEALFTQNQTQIKNALKQEVLLGLKLHYDGKYALMVLKPVKQIGGEHAAYMVEITPNHTFFAQQADQFVALLIIIALLLAVLMWYVYRYNRSILLLEQYKHAIDESLIVSKTDSRGIITYVNRRFTQTNGYSEEELIGKPHSIIRHPDTPESVFKEMFDTISQGNIFQRTLKNRTKKGESYFVNLSICPIVNEDGEIVEHIGICEDITMIQNALLKAEEAEQVKSAFIANMSHEIRTPLNGIVGFVQLLSTSSLDLKQQHYISIIKNSIDTLMHIVNDILDFSKIQEGKIEIELIEINPNIQLDAVFSLFMFLADEKKIEYLLSLDTRLHQCLKLDIFRLKQVISNLISNALKFTSAGGKVRVNIEVVEDTASYQRIRFAVSDTGIGIPLDKQGKIFEKFTQADSSTTRQFGGTGLGLSISYAMVGLMGGVLEVNSKEGEGSTFSFELKAAKCNALENRADVFEQQTTNITHTPLSLNVLVAEDYDVNQILIDELLRHNYGIKADFANNGEMAVEMAAAKNYDLILMDVNMPIIDGIEATRIIRQTQPALPIVALTANTIEGDRERFIAAGMNDYLTKPLDMGALHEVLIRYFHTDDRRTHEQKESQQFNDAFAELKNDLGISDEILIRLNNKFFQSVRITLEKLKEAIIAENYKEVSMQAHSVKGSSSTLRYTTISDIAAMIEEHARGKNNYPYMQKLNELFNEFRAAEEGYRLWESETE
jgi:hypothetical protein